jgi:hypothetical protein
MGRYIIDPITKEKIIDYTNLSLPEDMLSMHTEFTAGSSFISSPKWEFKFCKNSSYTVQVDEAPNWFHRFLQKLILGIVWKRIKQ